MKAHANSSGDSPVQTAETRYVGVIPSSPEVEPIEVSLYKQKRDLLWIVVERRDPATNKRTRTYLDAQAFFSVAEDAKELYEEAMGRP